LVKLKWFLLAAGGFGFMDYLVVYMGTWFYPIISSLYGKLILLHLMHWMLLMGTIMVKGGIVKPEYFAIYMGAYFIAFAADVVGCIWRTVIFANWGASLATFGGAFGLAMLLIEWLLPPVSFVMFIIGFFISRLVKLHLYAQTYAIGIMGAKQNIPGAKEEMERALRVLRRDLGLRKAGQEPGVPAGEPKLEPRELDIPRKKD
jgi:hypothetical protein